MKGSRKSSRPEVFLGKGVLNAPNAPFLYPLKTSGGRERVHWKRMDNVSTRLFTFLCRIIINTIEIQNKSHLK